MNTHRVTAYGKYPTVVLLVCRCGVLFVFSMNRNSRSQTKAESVSVVEMANATGTVAGRNRRRRRRWRRRLGVRLRHVLIQLPSYGILGNTPDTTSTWNTAQASATS